MSKDDRIALDALIACGIFMICFGGFLGWFIG